MYGARFILLDDTRTFKNWESSRRLEADPSYRRVTASRWTRNGFAVFERVQERRAEAPPMLRTRMATRGRRRLPGYEGENREALSARPAGHGAAVSTARSTRSAWPCSSVGRDRDWLGLRQSTLLLHGLLASLGVDEGCVVDIAACDGVTNSNSIGLYREGWRGLAVEGDADSFSRLAWIHRRSPAVALARLWVTPENVASLLRAYGVPDDFEVLSLDIDGYDHFVLAALLAEDAGHS